MAEVHKKTSKFKLREAGFLISAFIVPLISFIVFFIYPKANSFLLGFQTTKFGVTTWGFDNFREIFRQLGAGEQGSELLTALKNTFIWLAYTIVMIPFQILTTYFVYKKVRGFRFIRFTFLLPGLLPAAVYVTLFKYLFAANGAYGYIAEHFFNTFSYPILNSKEVIYLMLGYSALVGLGGNMLLWGGAMKNAGTDVLEAARIDGANWMQELTMILLPLIWPTLSVTFMFLVAGFLGASGPILVFTNGRNGTSTLSFYIFSQVKYANNYEMPAATGLLMTAISLPLVFIVRHFASKREIY